MNRLILTQGSTFSIGKDSSLTTVFGTSAGVETVSIAAGAKVVLDASFNRGGDVINLSGNAASYTAVKSGSSIILTDALGTSVTIPVGTAGALVSFADSTPRRLIFDRLAGSNGEIKLGDDIVDGTADTLSAGTAAPTQTITLTKSAPTVDEGATTVLTLNTTGVPAGSQYAYAISGVSAADVVGGALTGLVTIGFDGVGLIPVGLVADALTEGAETLTVSVAGVSQSIAVNDTSVTPAAPVEQTDFVVTAGQIATALATSSPIAVAVGDTGNRTVTIQSDGATPDQVIINGDANTTITSGAQGDEIVVSGNGNNTVNSGAGNDIVTTFGTGNNTVNSGDGDDIVVTGTGSDTINVGTGIDTVTSGAGDDTIIFASGALLANDTVNAGTGNDTVVISGDDNVISTGLTGVENIVLNGTTVGVTDAALATLISRGLVSISGNAATSVITVTAAASSTVDLTSVALNDLNNLQVVITGGGTATVKLSATQIAELGAITEVSGTLTVNTSVAGFQALGSKALGSAVVITDTVENLIAAGSSISGATASLGNATVAQAAAALASGLTVSYTLVDSAANLALAPTSVFVSATAVTVSGEANAAQATAIQASIVASNAITTVDIAAPTLTLNVRDTASNVSNYLVDTIDADTVAAVGDAALTVAQAIALASLNPNATFQVVDTPANLAAAASGSLDRASQITANAPLTVAQVGTINTRTTGAATDIASGYALVDNLANLTAGGAATAVNNAANITANDASVSVSQALSLEALGNTGTTSYVLDDTLVNLLAASTLVTSSATAVSVTGTAALTVANINSLVSKFGTAKVSDASLAVSDTVANLLNLSAGSVAEASAITVSSGVATVADAVALKALTGAKMPATFTVTDSVANLSAGLATATTLTLLDSATVTINVTGDASVANVASLNAALLAGAGAKTAVDNGYSLSDGAAALALGANNAIVAGATVVTVTGDASVAQIVAINALGSPDPTGYALRDTASSLDAAATPVVNSASTVTVTDSATLLQIQNIKADFDTTLPVAVLGTSLVYTIADAPSAFDTAVVADLAILNGATTATMIGTKAQIFGGTLTTAKRDVADTIIAKDALADLTFTTAQLAEVDAIQINDANLTVANAAAVNALAAAKPTSYSITDSYALLTAATPSAAVVTFLANAATVVVDADTIAAGLEVLTVSQFNSLDALTAGTIQSKLTGTVAELTAANAATAVASAVGFGVTVTDTGASVAQAATLVARGLPVSTIVVTDTAAAIQAAAATLVAAVDSFVVSDNGFISGSVALISKVYAANTNTGSSYGNYALVDTAANLVALADISAVSFAQSVTVSGNATQAQADTLAGLSVLSPISYSISDTAANIAAGSADGRNEATNITVTGAAATLAQAGTINGATNSGTDSYAISDTAAALAAASGAAIAAIEAATGTVTATGDATGAEASLLAAYAKAVVFSVSDTPTALAASTGLGEAVNIVSTGATATTAQAATIMAAANTGTTTISAVSGTAAQALTLTLGANDTITGLSVTGTTTIADAVAINAKDTGANIGAVSFATVSGSAADLLANKGAANLATVGVTVTDTMTVAQAAALDAAITPALTYTITDSLANIMADTTPTGAVDNAAVLSGRSVTVTDTVLTVAQATSLLTTGGSSYVYSIQDNDANIVTAVNASSAVLTGATSVRGADGVALTVATVGSAFGIVGTKAQLDSLPTVLQGATKVYEVSVADLAANPDFYVAAGIQFRVTDTAANLTSSNALLPRAAALVATDAASVAQATVMTTLGVATVSYSLSDTATALTAAAGATSVVDGAVNVVVTGTATFAQAATIDGETNSGTLTMNISDVNANVAGSTAARNSAVNITITDALTAANATTLLAATNSGSTTLANVSDAPAALAALTLTSNDTITSLTPNAAVTVAQLTALQARSATITAYNLTDTAANLAAATAGQLNGATNIALLSGSATVAQAAIIDAATNTGTATFEIADTAANILAAPTALLGEDANDIIVVTDTTVTAEVATQLRALDTANTGFTIIQGGAAGVFAISDTAANLTATANAAAVTASTDVSITGEVTVAEANAVDTAAGSDTPTYNLADTYSRLVAGGATTTTATNVRITNLVTVAQANQAASTFGVTAAQLFVDIRDNASALSAGLSGGGVTAAETITLSTAATVAQAGVLSESAKLVGGYTISDTAAAVVSAINTANAAGAADRSTVVGATSVTLTTAATVAQALGVRATEARGIYTLSGVSYAITDTAANIITGFNSSDGLGIDNATAVRITDTDVTVAQAVTLTGLANFVGDDGLGGYDIADGFAAVQLADEALITDASTVQANGTAAAQTIDMSAIGRAVYVNGNGGVDTMFGTDFADTMDGGTDADVMDGGNGRDAFRVDADGTGTDSSTGARDQIIDFTLATASWTGSAANDTVAEFQALAIGGSGADILDINLTGVTVAIEANAASTVSTTAATLAESVKTSLAAGATGDITVAVTNGIMSISSTVGADFDTLDEVVAAAQLVAATNGETLGFEFGGSTYVFTQNGAHDILVELTAVTGVAGLDLLDTTGTVGGANWVIIG